MFCFFSPAMRDLEASEYCRSLRQHGWTASPASLAHWCNHVRLNCICISATSNFFKRQPQGLQSLLIFNYHAALKLHPLKHALLHRIRQLPVVNAHCYAACRPCRRSSSGSSPTAQKVHRKWSLATIFYGIHTSF